MCIVKTPKVQASATAEAQPDPAVIRNPYLDGIDPATKALRQGRSSLRIERAAPGAASASTGAATAFTNTAPSSAPALVPVLPKITPVRGGGGSTGRLSGAFKNLA